MALHTVLAPAKVHSSNLQPLSRVALKDREKEIFPVGRISETHLCPSLRLRDAWKYGSRQIRWQGMWKEYDGNAGDEEVWGRSMRADLSKWA